MASEGGMIAPERAVTLEVAQSRMRDSLDKIAECADAEITVKINLASTGHD